jgi:hypothetical protein
MLNIRILLNKYGRFRQLRLSGSDWSMILAIMYPMAPTGPGYPETGQSQPVSTGLRRNRAISSNPVEPDIALF